MAAINSTDFRPTFIAGCAAALFISAMCELPPAHAAAAGGASTGRAAHALNLAGDIHPCASEEVQLLVQSGANAMQALSDGLAEWAPAVPFLKGLAAVLRDASASLSRLTPRQSDHIRDEPGSRGT